ncbi:MAG TPA: hypothetical protein VGV93_12400 [Acidimicrobiales bacterium]|nr:hypothetical protein [Acidimicrobiales bacterium]
MASRDVERNYSVTQFAAKLRRLADALEADRPFRIQVTDECTCVPKSLHQRGARPRPDPALP